MLLGSLTASFLGSALADKRISKGAGLCQQVKEQQELMMELFEQVQK